MYYIVKVPFCANLAFYPMGILWVWYGYPMVSPRKSIDTSR